MAPTPPHRSRRALATLACWSLLALFPRSFAAAQADELEDANRRAIEAYVELDIDRARELLEHAIARADASGAAPDARARSYVHLGIIYVAGMDNAEAGANAFVEALLLAPDIEPDPNLSTPAVQRVFEHARLEAEMEAERRAAAASTASEPLAPTPPPLPPAAPQAYDAEVPPEGFSQDSEAAEDTSGVRGFLRVGFAPSSAYISQGAKPDRQPPAELPQDQFAAQNWACPRDDAGNLSRTDCRVGVLQGGFVATYALRVEVGLQVSERLALSATARVQFDAGEGALARSLLGVRAHYLLTEPRTAGFHASLFASAMVGQVQVQPRPGLSEPKPYVKSGPGGLGLGGTLGYRFANHVGLYVTPDVTLLFPNRLFNMELSLGPELWW